MLSAAEIASVAEAAVAAPSADNAHLFVLRMVGDVIHIHGNEAFVAAPYHKRVLALVSFGAVIENIVVRAARLGYDAKVSERGDRADPSLVARLSLTQAPGRDTGLDAAIPTRVTNRTVRFSGPPLADAELAAFTHLLADLPVSLAFHDGARRASLLRLVRIAEAERFNTRALHADLFSAVRFDVGWSASADHGLPPGALGIEPGMRAAFARLRHWPVMNALRKLGVHHVLGLRAAALPCRLAPHVGVISTRLPIDEGALAGGRALERVWLEAERRGLAFQPFAGAPLLALPGYDAVPAATGRRLREGWKALTGETPVIVFRMGRAARPKLRAGRPAGLAGDLLRGGAIGERS